MTPTLVTKLDITPALAYIVEQYNLNTSSIFPVAQVLYYIKLISAEINVLDG